MKSETKYALLVFLTLAALLVHTTSCAQEAPKKLKRQYRTGQYNYVAEYVDMLEMDASFVFYDKNYHPYPLYDGMDSLHILLLKGGQVIKTHIETGDTLLSSCYIPQMYYTPHCIDTKASGQYTELLANRMRLHEIDADKAPTSFPIFYTTQRTAPSSPHEPYVPYNPDDPEWNWTLSDIYYQFPFEVCDQLLERSQGKYIEEGDRFGFW